MNDRMLILLILLISSSPLLCIPVSSGECPPGSSDCFLCGGVGGIPCTTNCQGVWDPYTQAYVSCRCPQGKPCECYCPYTATPTPTRIQTKATPRATLIARIAVNQRSSYAPCLVEFSDESTGPVSSRLWDFGHDQRTSMLKSPSIIFSNPGTYRITLTVVDADGNKATDSIAITVQPPPVTTPPTTGLSSIPLPAGIIIISILLAVAVRVRKA